MITVKHPVSGDQQTVEDPAPYLAAGYEEIAEGQLLSDLQADLWDRVKALRAAKLLLAPTAFGTAQADDQGKANISGLVQMATIAKATPGGTFSEVFTMADNSEVLMTADQMIAFGVAVAQHISAVHARGRDLRAAIFNPAIAADDLAAIDIEAGWPGE